MMPRELTVRGSGVTALVVAMKLCERGHAVTVHHHSPCGQGPSTANQGWLRSGLPFLLGGSLGNVGHLVQERLSAEWLVTHCNNAIERKRALLLYEESPPAREKLQQLIRLTDLEPLLLDDVVLGDGRDYLAISLMQNRVRPDKLLRALLETARTMGVAFSVDAPRRVDIDAIGTLGGCSPQDVSVNWHPTAALRPSCLVQEQTPALIVAVLQNGRAATASLCDTHYTFTSADADDLRATLLFVEDTPSGNHKCRRFSRALAKCVVEGSGGKWEVASPFFSVAPAVADILVDRMGLEPAAPSQRGGEKPAGSIAVADLPCASLHV